MPLKKKVDKTIPDRKEGIGWSGKRSWSWPKEEGERGMCGLLISILVITNITCLPPPDAWSLLEPVCAGSTAGSWGLGWPLVWLGSAGCRGDASVGAMGASKVPADICLLEMELHLPALLLPSFARADASWMLWDRGGHLWSLPHLPAPGQDELPGPPEPPMVSSCNAKDSPARCKKGSGLPVLTTSPCRLCCWENQTHLLIYIMLIAVI